MPFRGVTFSGQNVTPKNDGGLYQAHYGDGVLWGCSMAISGDDLVIQSGEFIAGGRVCFVDGATNVDLSGRLNNTGYIQVIMNYDMTQGEGSQWYTTFVESATTTFPALTQGNINDTDTLYQLQLAIIQVSGGNLTSIYSHRGQSGLLSKNTLYITNDENDATLFMGDSTEPTIGFLQASSVSKLLRIGNFVGSNINSGIDFNNSGNTVIYGNAQACYIRPNGRNSNTGAFNFTAGGHLSLLGSNPMVQNSTGNAGIRFYDTNNPVIFAGGTNIYFRPNGVNENSGSVSIDSTGRVVGSGMYSSTTTGSANLVIGSGGVIQRTTSLRKYKKNIKPISEKDAEKGYELNPVSFVSVIEDDNKHEQYGFIAEEVAETLPNLGTYSLEGELDGVAYDRVCAILLKQNQMLKARVDELEKRVEKLEGK